MGVVNVKRIAAVHHDTDEVMKDMMKQASRQYGYGFEHIVYVSVLEDGAWALVADEYVDLGDTAIALADDYYNYGTNPDQVDACVSADNKIVQFLS